MGKNGTISYTYDSVGNRKTLTSTLPPIGGMTYNYDADDRLTSDNYDANGNTILSGGVSDVYDFENHLVQKGGVTIVYDGDGNRVSETVGSVTTKYLVDTNNPTGYAQVADELQNGAVTRSYSYGLERISETQSIGGTVATSFYGYDGHGNVRQLTNSTGAVTDTYDYDAFGNLINSTGSTPNVYLFAGEAYDAALGLYYNRARYLNTATARFWSMDNYEGDPESPLSLHKYTYASANSVDVIDPSGNESLVSISISTALNVTLETLPISAAIRAGQFAYRVGHGVDLGMAAQEAIIDLLQDAALTFATAGLLRYAVGTLPLRAAGTTFVRAANSIWNVAGNYARGQAVENFIFENVLGRARQLAWNFPIIDDFFQGVATSIKSLDLTAASYETRAAVYAKLAGYAEDLSNFAGRRWAGQIVDGALIKDRVLVVAIEDGAATVEQELGLRQFLNDAKTLWPNIKVAIQTIP